MARQPAWVSVFIDKFLPLLTIDSKERDINIDNPIELYEAQKRFLREVAEGLGNGIHYFVCLKARQLGLSTIMLALDIFWLYMHPGLQGALVADTADNKEEFRRLIDRILKNLPEGFQIPIKNHNRSALTLTNGSVLQYMVAGRKKNSGLGVSRALNFCHMTEASRWGDPEGFDSLLSSLSETHPNRLYVVESTAFGFNLFQEKYDEAAHDGITKKAIFVGWWSKESYRLPMGTKEFDHFWGQHPELTEEEAEKVEQVKRQYNYEVGPEQIAFYRKRQMEMGAETLARDYPWTASEAFVQSGHSFFSLMRVNADLQFISDNRVGFDGYCYVLGNTWLDTKIQAVSDVKKATLRVWEEPKPWGRYVIGVDPAYGRNPEADRSVISVWRCYSDKLVQVAEFCTPEPTTYEVCWVLCHLAGSYRDCITNIEVQGPGLQVMNELKTIRRELSIGELRDRATPWQRDALNSMQWFLYHKPDSPGPGYLYGVASHFNTKMQMLNAIRDSYNQEKMIIKSMPLLQEMATLTQDQDVVHASGRNKDDRVFAAGYANMAWRDWVQPAMMAEGRTYAKESERDGARAGLPEGPVIEGMVADFFKQAEEARTVERLRVILESDVP